MTPQEQIEVLEESKKYDVLSNRGLCFSIENALIQMGIAHEKPENIQEYIPLFTYKNARKFKAHQDILGFWWPLPFWEHRAKFREWIIKKLKKQL